MVAGVQPGLTPVWQRRGTSRGPDRPAAPVAVSASAVDQSLALAQQALTEAVLTPDVAHRYVCAHVAALRSAAALLADRTSPAPTRGRRQRNAWELLRQVAPELDEWIVVFEASARKRAIAEAGVTAAVSEREADDLVRDSEAFLGVVERAVGAPAHLPLDQRVRWA